jgi:integrase
LGQLASNHVSPVIGSLPIALVDTPQILQVLRPIWRDKHVTAIRVRERLESVLGWAIRSKLRSGPNPATMEIIKDVLGKPTHIVRHHAALSYKQINTLVTELLPRGDRDALALLLLILTATRAGAVIGARAKEFDLRARVWTVPPGRMKRRGQLKETEFASRCPTAPLRWSNAPG